MSNRLKMVQKELLYALFNKNWSDRKINDSIGIHRVTISRYRKEWHKLQKAKETVNITVSTLSLDENLPSDTVQNVPPGQNEVPTEGVVHFQVPTDPQPTCNGITSKSKVIQYYNEINLKLQNGQHARSIYQDLVSEHQYAGSYDSVKRYGNSRLKLTRFSR